MPVAWSIGHAIAKGTWRPHWEALVTHFTGCLPTTWTVLVLANLVLMQESR